MSADASLRDHLVELLEGGHAHLKFEDTIKGFPADRVGIRPEGAPHSAWELLEHLRLAQEDILRFSVSADWVSPKWPEGYWPASPAPAKEADWGKSVKAFQKDLAEFLGVIRDPKRDLHEKFPWGSGQTLLREALLIADHNAYHVGQLLLVRRLVGAWKE
jgi:hypothetical protein